MRVVDVDVCAFDAVVVCWVAVLFVCCWVVVCLVSSFCMDVYVCGYIFPIFLYGRRMEKRVKKHYCHDKK